MLFTSPQAPEFAGPAAQPFRHLPAFAVGGRTAAAARAAGFADVQVGGRDVALLLRRTAEAGHVRLLHLGGRERTLTDVPDGLTVETRVVYGADLADRFEEEALAALRSERIDWALLFSARTAGRFAALFDAAKLRRGALSVATISAGTLAVAGVGWRQAVAADVPSETGVLAAAGLLCDKPSE